MKWLRNGMIIGVFVLQTHQFSAMWLRVVSTLMGRTGFSAPAPQILIVPLKSTLFKQIMKIVNKHQQLAVNEYQECQAIEQDLDRAEACAFFQP
jgi:hypothetical protein